jgi:hypothetical protein
MTERSVTSLAPTPSSDTPERVDSRRVRTSFGDRLHRWSDAWWAPLAVFVSVGVLVWVAVWFGNNHLGHDLFFPTRPAVGGSWFGGWARWDAEWYRTIVREGYVYFPGVQSAVAFWPSYPMAVKALSWAFPSIYITGTVVTAASGAAAVMLLRRWAGVFVRPAVAITAVVVLCVYPYSWYLYGAVYADAFFIAATLAAFLLVERDRMFWAGIVGIAATAGRPAGIVVAVALVLRMLERRNTANGAQGFIARFNPRGMTGRDAPLFLSWLGVGGWCAFLWVKFGDPFLFATIQASKGWEQGAGPSTWLKFRLLEEIQHHPFAWSTIGHLVQGALTIGALFLVPRVARRFGWAYTLYVLGVIGLPLLGTKDFDGAGRYLLAAFPCIVILAEILVARPRLRVVLVPVSLLALLGMSIAFGRGSYIA